MAEEVDRPTRNVPMAIMTSLVFNGIIGLTMMLTLLYNVGDVESVLNSATGYPFLQVFYNTLQSVPGAVALGAITLALIWSCAIGILTTASRMSWSFARDRGAPFSDTLSKVDRRNQVPINAILVVGACSAVICLIYIGSSAAFNDVVSLNITGFYGSYFVPSAFLLYRRIKGHIKPYPGKAATTEDIEEVPEKVLASTTAAGNSSVSGARGDGETAVTEKGVMTDAAKMDLVPVQTSPSFADGTVAALEIIAEDHSWGWFHVPGWIGIANNIYACCYMVFVIFFSLWPSEYHPNASTMNYSIVVTSGVLIFSLIWYFIRARKEYHGPIIDSEVAAIIVQTAI